MFNSLGGLASRVVIFFSLIASFFRTLYLDQAFFSCTLIGSSSLGMAMSDLSFLYLARPYPWNVGNVWFIFPALYACIVHDVYVCVCVCFLVGDCALCIMNSRGQESNPFVIMGAFDHVVWVCTQGDLPLVIIGQNQFTHQRYPFHPHFHTAPELGAISTCECRCDGWSAAMRHRQISNSIRDT